MKTNRKGFTITELVIVIAVIAILAAVLIPSFSSMITKANDSAALQEARNAYSRYLSENAPAVVDGKVAVKIDGKYFKFDSGKIDEKYVTTKPDDYTIVCDEHVDTATADNVCDDCGTCLKHTWDGDESAAVGTECTHTGCGVKKPAETNP